MPRDANYYALRDSFLLDCFNEGATHAANNLGNWAHTQRNPACLQAYCDGWDWANAGCPAGDWWAAYAQYRVEQYNALNS